jgi:predicted ATP-grasp superfamily ATP-dependent carboligase
MASSPLSSAMNLLEHTGITVATSATTKAGIYAAAKVVETAKQMYNALVELEALEEEIALVEAIIRDTKTFLESPLCPSGL